MAGTASKKKPVSYKNDNLLEAIGSVSSGIGSGTIAEFGKIGGDIVNSLLGGSPRSGDLQPNQPIEFGSREAEPAPAAVTRAEFHPKPDLTRIEAETRQQIDAIRAELKALLATVKNLHKEVQNAVDADPVDPGIYHVNFYEQLRTFIKVLRLQLENSSTWLAAFSSRKKKMGYWGMFKKHGTNFGLSNERSLATAAG